MPFRQVHRMELFSLRDMKKHLCAQKHKIFFLTILIFPIIGTIFPSNLCLTLLGHESYNDATSATNVKGFNCF